MWTIGKIDYYVGQNAHEGDIDCRTNKDEVSIDEETNVLKENDARAEAKGQTDHFRVHIIEIENSYY